MGSGNSQPASVSHTKTTEEIYYDSVMSIPIGNTNHPFLFLETTKKLFFAPAAKAKKKELHDPKELCYLLLGCFEELNNVDEIIEYVVTQGSDQYEDILEELNDSYLSSLSIVKLHNSLENTVLQFGSQFFHPFQMLPPASFPPHEIPDSKRLYNGIYLAAQSFLSPMNKEDLPILKSVITYLSYVSPSSCMNPPTNFFFSSAPGAQELFSARLINTHGFCSNGRFLFSLCSEGEIVIFPLLNSGALSNPITKSIKMQFPQSASMIATKDQIQIYNLNKMYSVDIRSLLANKDSKAIKIQETRIDSDYMFIISDGVTTVRVMKHFILQIFDSRKPNDPIRTIQLKTGNNSLHQNVTTIFPQGDYNVIPMYINGSYISFIFHLDRNRRLARIFSLITGLHIHDEEFEWTEQLYATNYDAINKCIWTAILSDNNRFCVRRYYFSGSDDPHILSFYDSPSRPNSNITVNNVFSQFFISLNHLLYHMIGSQLFPLLLSNADIERLISYVELLLKADQAKIAEQRSAFISAIQSLIVLISLNLYNTLPSADTFELQNRLLNLITTLPINLGSYLFFHQFRFMMNPMTDLGISIMVGLFRQLSDDFMIAYSLRQIESPLLAYIPFNSTNTFSDLIPQSTISVDEYPAHLISLLLSHQRMLIYQVQTFLFLQPYAGIQYSGRTPQNTTPLDLFSDYAQILIPKFDATISLCDTEQQLKSSVILLLFQNFIELIASLNEFHSIARLITTLLNVLIYKLSSFIEEKSSPESPLRSMANLFIFTYGKFAATLVKGGYSLFEEEYNWLLKENQNLFDQPNILEGLASPAIEEFEDSRLNSFINSNAALDILYKKYKPQFNRNLNDEKKLLDRTAIVAFAHHMDCIDELYSYTGETQPSPHLKASFDQMLRIRNEYSKYVQSNKNTGFLSTKCLMLLRMNAGNSFNAKALGDFVLSSFQPSAITNIMAAQQQKISTTLIGFALLDNTFNADVHPLFNEIISYTLSQIDKFDGLASIMKITSFTQQQAQQVDQFFQKVSKSIANAQNNRLIIVAYRFFRDLVGLNEIQNSFLTSLIYLFKQQPTRYSLFVVALSLMPKIIQIPEPLLDLQTQNPLDLLLLAEALKVIPIAPESFSLFEQLVWVANPLNIKYILRLVYYACNSIDEQTLNTFFVQMIKTIGEEILKFRDLTIANEMTNFMRSIIMKDPPYKKFLVNLILNINLSNSSEKMLIGVFSVLGGNLENIRPSCTIRHHPNRNTSNEYYVVLDTSYIYYQKPFNINVGKQQPTFDQNTTVYAVPQIELDFEHFPYEDFILQFFIPCYEGQVSQITFSLYIQVIARFCKFTPFVEALTPQMLIKLSENPIPFNDIYDTLINIQKMANIQQVKEHCGFNYLSFGDHPFVTYLSPPMVAGASQFDVTFTINDGVFQGYIGVVTDNVDPDFTRYNLIEFPTGRVYPIGSSMPQFPNSLSMKFEFDPLQKKFMFNGNTMDFPVGVQFRIMISVTRNTEIDILIPEYESVFILNSYPPINMFDQEIEKDFYIMPQWVSRCQHILPISFKDLPPVASVMTNIPKSKKRQLNFITPPQYIVIHPRFLRALPPKINIASAPIIVEMIKGLFRQLALQWSSVALMRIALYDPDKVDVFKLFSLFVIPLESFIPSNFTQGNFPFSLEDPIWNATTQTNFVYLSLEKEMKEALRLFTIRTEYIDKIGHGIKQLSASKKLHLCCLPNHNHNYYDPTPTVLHLFSYGIIAFNDFNGPNAGLWPQNPNFALPALVRTFPYDLQTAPTPNELSILSINPMNNNWIYNTAFQLILLWKNFVYIAKTAEQRAIAKAVFLDCFISQSPFILKFLPQLADFIQIQLPSTPLDRDNSYIDRLLLLGGMLIYKPSPRFITFYQHEQRVLSSTIATELAIQFPEFFSMSLPVPSTTVCKMPSSFIDPGAIKDKFASHILMLQLFTRSYKSLVGFPFWEILPLWFRVSGAWRGNTDYIEPFVKKVRPEVVCVTNPSSDPIQVTLRIKVRYSAEALVMVSQSQMFEDAIYVQGRQLREKIPVHPGDTYFSVNCIDGGWDNVDVILPAETHNILPPEEVDITTFKDRFIHDMHQFAIDWDESHTDELLNLLPRFALREPTFVSVEAIAKSSSLCSQFSQTVVCLKALLIHHYNYIRHKRYAQVPESLWNSFTRFVSNEEVADMILNKVISNDIVPELRIDRHAAQRLISEGRGNPRCSVIMQLSRAIAKIGATKFRNKKSPWKVAFHDELAIDAGGPCRELLTEAALSIFERTTGITIPIPDARVPGASQHSNLFIPYDPYGANAPVYYAVGVILAIIIRTGISQDIPFAPIVWKHLAKEKITYQDICSIDSNLSDTFQALRQGTIKTNWTVDTWAGARIVLPNHIDQWVDKEDIEIYIYECVKYRIDSITPQLKMIRKGFRENIGFKHHSLMTGAILSRLAQGSGIIAVEHLKQITAYIDIENGIKNPYVQRYWKAVERFSPEQRKLLLKFITTLTRLPNVTIFPDFKIKIDLIDCRNPDQTLPTAATCFNKLHLPKYTSEEIAYQKILYAIQFCQTMESK